MLFRNCKRNSGYQHIYTHTQTHSSMSKSISASMNKSISTSTTSTCTINKKKWSKQPWVIMCTHAKRALGLSSFPIHIHSIAAIIYSRFCLQCKTTWNDIAWVAFSILSVYFLFFHLVHNRNAVVDFWIIDIVLLYSTMCARWKLKYYITLSFRWEFFHWIACCILMVCLKMPDSNSL